MGGIEAGFDLRELIPMWIDRPLDTPLDDAYLDVMAWQMDIDIRGLAQVEQLALIREAIALYRRAGTPGAIRRMLGLMRFDNVSIVEGSLRDLVHDGFWSHNGMYTHGADFADWAVFSVSIVGRRGVIGDRVWRVIDKLRPTRSKLVGLSVTLLSEVVISGPIYTIELVTASAAIQTDYEIEPGTPGVIIINVGDALSDVHITGVRALDDAGEAMGDVVFDGEVWRGRCPVVIRLSVIYPEVNGPVIDSARSVFDDETTTF